MLSTSRRLPRSRRLPKLLAPALTATVLLAGATGLTELSSVGTAVASTSDFTSFSPPITGAANFISLPPTGSIGPIGMVNDGTNFYVTDFGNGNLYKYPLTGGSTPLASATDNLFGLAYANGNYFATELGEAIVTFNPNTLAVSQTNVQLPCGSAEGIAADPTTNDLYVGTACGVFRVQDPTGKSPIVTHVALTSQVDGISIATGGQTIWAAATVMAAAVEISSSGTILAIVPDGRGVDGIGIAQPNVTSNGINVSNNVFINNNDGTILRIDTNNGNAASIVASGGTRGDMAITGPDGCLYVTQSTEIDKLAPCFFQPPTPTVTVSAGGAVSATEGSSITANLATISESDPSVGTSAFSAKVNWGDGTSSQGTVTGSNGSFTVVGGHSYADEGSYTITVGVTVPGGQSDEVTTTATVGDATLSATGVPVPASTQTVSGTLATFTDANPNATTADFTSGGGSVSIAWGDGVTSSGSVAQSGPGTFTVSGSHTYTAFGPESITVKVIDEGGSMASAQTSVLIYGLPKGGAFVVGNASALVGSTVTFWGAHWVDRNELSGGAAPAPFKGFAAGATGTCGSSWTSRAGNSDLPPSGPLPSYMGVIVASSIHQTGAVISGNAVDVAVVKTTPGYAPDPGNSATGTVVTLGC